MLKKCLDSIKKHTFNDNVTIYVADDSIERKGVAYRKNECLRALKDCDYVFLLDDDVSIIKDGWIENFIRNSKYLPHLLYLNENHRPVFIGKEYGVYNDCGGVFMFMTKECIDKVGAFNESFFLWGFEHAEYSKRICYALDTGYAYISLNNTSEYIYSEDYSNPNHKSSITNEEKNLLFRKNFPIFAKGIDKIYIPL